MSSTLFLRNNSANVRVVVFICISLLTMFLDYRHGYLDKLRSALSVIIYPVQYVTNTPIMAINWSTEFMMARSGLIKENAQMRKEQLLLNAKIQKLAILEAENRRLREMLRSSEKLYDRVLIAELLSIELKPFRHKVVINKGQRDKVYDGQPIIDAQGVMGQVVHVGPFSSVATLLTDPSHAVPVQINRNGLKSLAIGTGQNHILQLEHLPNNADVMEGDLVISSGLGDRFPAGYPVGTVNSVNHIAGEPFLEITIIPSAQIVKSREVLLVWPEQQADSGQADGLLSRKVEVSQDHDAE